MCGSYSLNLLESYDLTGRFNLDLKKTSIKELKNLRFRPKSEVPTISKNSPNKLVTRYWSLLPPWLKNIEDLNFPTFNARAESLREKPTFRNAWKSSQRCLVIATEFHEWQKQMDGKKVISRHPYTFKVRSQDVFAMAGLYSVWNDIESVTIITTEPNHDMKEIHNRMPVILDQADEELWLSKKTDLEIAYKLLQPYP